MSDPDVAFCLTHGVFHAIEMQDVDCEFEDGFGAPIKTGDSK